MVQSLCLQLIKLSIPDEIPQDDEFECAAHIENPREGPSSCGSPDLSNVISEHIESQYESTQDLVPDSVGKNVFNHYLHSNDISIL